MHGDHTRVLRGGLLLVHVIPEVLIVERQAAAERTVRPRAIPRPRLEVHGRILRVSSNLSQRQDTPEPTLLSIQFFALELRIRDCKSCFVTGERPYHHARGRRHLTTAYSFLFIGN